MYQCFRGKCCYYLTLFNPANRGGRQLQNVCIYSTKLHDITSQWSHGRLSCNKNKIGNVSTMLTSTGIWFFASCFVHLIYTVLILVTLWSFKSSEPLTHCNNVTSQKTNPQQHCCENLKSCIFCFNHNSEKGRDRLQTSRHTVCVWQTESVFSLTAEPSFLLQIPIISRICI